MKTFYKTLFLLIILMPKFCLAQLSVCYDDDGYTNIRKLPSKNSKIIDKIIECQVFAIAFEQYENKSKDWVAINFPNTNDKSEKDFLKFDGDQKVGYIHKSRIVNLEDLLKLNKTEINNNKVVHSNKNLQITLETQIFAATNHKIIKTNEGSFLIDGKKSYPYYGGNTTEIKNITLKTKSNTYTFPKKSFKNLFMVNAANTIVYMGKKGEYYPEIDAGDGADGYNIIYCLKNNQVFSMTITSMLP